MNQNPIISIEPETPDVSIEIKVSNEGEPGYTPQRGLDYWTDADKREIVDFVKQEIGELPGGGTVKSVNGKSPDKNGNVVVDPELPSAWDIPSADPLDPMPYDKVLGTEFGSDGEPKWVLQSPPSAEAVRYTTQTLNVNQQAQARKNIGAQPAGDYALKSEIPSVAVRSVNGKTGDVVLTADDVGAAKKEDIDRLSEEIDALKGEDPDITVTNYTQDELAENGTEGLIDLDGAIQSTASFRTSAWIPISAGDAIDYLIALYPSACGLAFYNATKTFISGIYGTNTPYNPEDMTAGKTIAPENAVYMRYCMRINLSTFTGQYVTATVTSNAGAVRGHYVLDELYGKTLTATGDSITAATSSVPGNSYVEQIAVKHAMQVENKAIWGAVFASGLTNKDGTPMHSILDTIATMRDDADYIIISGGINDTFKLHEGTMQLGEIAPYYTDTHDTTTFCGAFEETLKRALLKWPGKKILFVIEHRMNNGYSSGTDILFSDTVYPKMVKMLHHWGVPYVDLYHDMPSLVFITEYRDLYTNDADGDGVGDGWHPNAEGYRLFYVPRVEAGLRRI